MLSDETRCAQCGGYHAFEPHCARPPFVDLTVMAADIPPQSILNDPRYVPQPDMPEGEPDIHDLIVMVRQVDAERRAIIDVNYRLFKRVRSAENIVAALEAFVYRSTDDAVCRDVKMQSYIKSIESRVLLLEASIAEIRNYLNLRDPSFSSGGPTGGS